ncbi:hypothetical protein PHMEG_00030661, partial [Phytophthora megakarya]
VIDSFDGDDLYPYLPSERVRKNVSAAFVLTTGKSESDEEKLGVTLQRAAFVKTHRPVFELSEATWQTLQQAVALWGEIVIRSIRSLPSEINHICSDMSMIFVVSVKKS